MSRPADPPRSGPGPAAAQLAATRRRDRRLLLGVAAGLVLLVVVGVLGHRALVGPAAEPTVGPGPAAGQQATDVVTGRPLLLGDAGAPVTLTLYEDFRCPHCADLESRLGPTIDGLRDAGTLRVHLMPMAFIDDGSTAASNAVACAAAAGFGAAYHSALFAHQDQPFDADRLVALGVRSGGGDDPRFASCVRGDEHGAWVASVNAAATTADVVATPTAFLDGVPVDIAGLTPQTLTETVQQAARS